MLGRESRELALANFEAQLGEANTPMDGLQYIQLSTGVHDEIYGPVVASNLEYLRQHEKPDVALDAALALSSLVRISSSRYRNNYPEIRNSFSDDFDLSPELMSEISTLQTQAAHGEAAYLLPSKYAMTKDESLDQVLRADTVLSEAREEVLVALANANYSLYFTPKVMATAADIPEASIEELIKADGVEKMPHLVRTNLAIGQIVGRLARDAKGKLTIVDIGSGTGATLASIFGELNGAHSFENTNVVAIEPNRDFARTLQDFAIKAVKQARKANPRFGISFSSNSDLVIAEPELQVVRNPVSKVDLTGDVLPQGKDDVAVITANYALHRLTSGETTALARRLGDSAENVICLFADLMANGSEINRRHFNFGNNGPLNCGNIALQKSLEAAGFVVRKIGETEAPTSVQTELATKIAAEADNDGHMWIAYKGTEAQRLILAA
jgi:hypothetical protein